MNAAPAAPGGALEGLLHKLRLRDSLSEAEAQVLHEAQGELVELPPGRTLVRAGQSLVQSTLLVEGMIARYKDLSQGQRQIMEIHVPGDFVDLHGFLLKRLEHNVGTLTRVRIVYFPHEALERITTDHPHLTRMLWLSTLIDSSIQREHILSVGRRTAVARIAHIICELYVRLQGVGHAQEGRFALPLTQLDLADTSGLTAVHVNRMLRQLRDEGLMTFRAGQVTIHDWDGLARVAEFDPAFLFLDSQPR